MNEWFRRSRRRIRRWLGKPMFDPKQQTELHQLADWIREGATRSKPHRGWMANNRACALGAAWLAMKNHTKAEVRFCSQDISGELVRRLPVLLEQVPAPKNLGMERIMIPLRSLVMHLNDSRGWERERIADFVDCLADR